MFFELKPLPSRVVQLDWSNLNALGVSMRGRPREYLLCHAVLTCSKWEWATGGPESLLRL